MGASWTRFDEHSDQRLATKKIARIAESLNIISHHKYVDLALTNDLEQIFVEKAS